MNDYQNFFGNVVPDAINKLQAETVPKWGKMNAHEVVQHLRLAIQMSLENQNGKVKTPEDRLPLFKKFLMSDKPFRPFENQPEFFDRKIESNGFEELKDALLKELEQLLQWFKKHPQHKAVHESFGTLGVEEWTQLHFKHFRHHLSQFGLIET